MIYHKKAYYLAGIVSFGYKCADSVPGVYTRVAEFTNWIIENTGLNFQLTNTLHINTNTRTKFEFSNIICTVSSSNHPYNFHSHFYAITDSRGLPIVCRIGIKFLYFFNAMPTLKNVLLGKSKHFHYVTFVFLHRYGAVVEELNF